ncbi:MAG: hypothetical protein WDM77_03405 [Steroidobacteraceae bacterium]
MLVKRLGDREQTEHRIVGDRPLLALAAVAENLVIGALAAALHADDPAEVQARGDVALDRRRQKIKPLGVEPGMSCHDNPTLLL